MTENPRLAPYIPRIPPLSTAARSFAFFFANMRLFAICAIVPLVLSQAIWLACYFLIGGFWDEIAAKFISIIPATLFIITWCRIVLLDHKRGLLASVIRWGRPHWQVAWILILIHVIRTPVQDLFIPLVTETETYIGYAGLVIYLLLYFLCFAVTLRMALAQPSHAVGAPISLARAWDISREQGLRLLVAVYMVTLPFFVAEHALDIAFEAATALPSEWSDDNGIDNFDWRYLPYSFAASALYFANGALMYLVLCFAFRLLTGWRGPREDIVARFD
mgnify:CR=1 FL=1